MTKGVRRLRTRPRAELHRGYKPEPAPPLAVRVASRVTRASIAALWLALAYGAGGGGSLTRDHLPGRLESHNGDM